MMNAASIPGIRRVVSQSEENQPGPAPVDFQALGGASAGGSLVGTTNDEEMPDASAGAVMAPPPATPPPGLLFSSAMGGSLGATTTSLAREPTPPHPSRSAEGLHLTEGSVGIPTNWRNATLVIPNNNNRMTSATAPTAAAIVVVERDISSSSLSDDAEDDEDEDDDDNYNSEYQQGNRRGGGGLLRFVANFAGGGPSSGQQQQARHHPPRRPEGSPMAPVATATTAADQEQDGSSSVDSTFGRTGSQNSSRDWGWFEDVHQSLNEATGGGLKSAAAAAVVVAAGSSAAEGGAAIAAAAASGNGLEGEGPQHGTEALQRQSQQHQQPPKKKRGGWVPQVSSGGEIRDYPTGNNLDGSDAAAMAVTAPNYILEESRSTQLLWKETAGQRPPQPVEERAFYEKMWAQNFARSKVEYEMPLEVLMATSPIALSPYFDAQYVTSVDDPHGGGPHHLHDVDYTSAAAAGGAAAGDAATAVAEAALQSRMNQGRDPGGDPSSRARTGGAGVSSSAMASSSSAILPNRTLVNRVVHNPNGSDLVVLEKGDNVFGTTVSKSFARGQPGTTSCGVDTVNISIASYRVVEARNTRKKSGSLSSSSGSSGGGSGGGSCGGGKYAQFLVIYREGSIRDTIGVWKRYSDFEELARKVTQSHEGCKFAIANMSPLAVTEEAETEHLPNAITSWRLLKKRQRWYRCLDAGYLSLKVFLLERFLHDILFESSSPKLLRDFVGADTM